MEMSDEPLLRRPVVVRAHGHDCMGPDLEGASSAVHGVRSVVRPHTRHDDRAIPYRLDDRPEEVDVLLVGGRCRLPRRPIDHQTVMAQFIDEVGREPLTAVDVKGSISVERRDHRREHRAEGRLG